MWREGSRLWFRSAGRTDRRKAQVGVDIRQGTMSAGFKDKADEQQYIDVAQTDVQIGRSLLLSLFGMKLIDGLGQSK